MATIGDITAKLNADATGFVGGMQRAIDSVTDLSRSLGFARGKVLAFGAAGAAIAAGGIAAATAQAAQFERTIRGAAARAGATQQAVTQFGQAAKQASLDSAFSASEAGKSLRFLAKSGFEVRQATQALPGILQGATAAGMDAAEMGEIASNALRAFGQSASNTGKIMDVLVKGATSANTSVRELGKGIGIVGGLANEAGMGIESVVSLMANMQDAGIGASRAAVAIRRGISNLIQPTGKTAEALQQVGVNTKDAQGEFRGLIPVLQSLEDKGASSSEMLQIFGKRAGPTLQTALSNGAGALTDFRKKLENSEGTSKRMAKFIRGSLVEQLKVLWGSIKTLGTNIGEVFLPAVKIAVQGLQGLVVVLNELVNFSKALASQFINLEATLGDNADTADSMGGSVGQASQKMEALQAAQQGAAGTARDFKNAQEGVNDAIKEFNDLSLSQQRQTFDELAQKAGDVQSKIDSMRASLSRARRRFTRQYNVAPSQLPEGKAGEQVLEAREGKLAGMELSSIRRKQKQLNSLIENRKEIESDINDVVEERLDEQAKTTAIEFRLKAARSQSKIQKERFKLKAKLKSLEASISDEKRLQLKRDLAREKAQQRINELQKQQRGEADREAIEKMAGGGGTGGGTVVRSGMGASGVQGMGGTTTRRSQDDLLPGGKRARTEAEAKKEANDLRSEALGLEQKIAVAKTQKATADGKSAKAAAKRLARLKRELAITRAKQKFQEGQIDKEQRETAIVQAKQNYKRAVAKQQKQITKEVEETTKATDDTLRKARELTGAAGQFAGAMAEAAGATDDVQTGIDAAETGITGALSAAGQFGSGNIAGGIATVASTGASLISTLAGGENRNKAKQIDRNRDEEFATLLATRMADELEERQVLRQDITLGAGRDRSSRQRARDDYQELQREQRLQEGSS